MNNQTGDFLKYITNDQILLSLHMTLHDNLALGIIRNSFGSIFDHSNCSKSLVSRNRIKIISNSPLVVSQVVCVLSIDVDQEVVSLQTEVGRKTPAGDLKQDLLFHISMADTRLCI